MKRCFECGCSVPDYGTPAGMGWNEDCEACAIAAGCFDPADHYDYHYPEKCETCGAFLDSQIRKDKS